MQLSETAAAHAAPAHDDLPRWCTGCTAWRSIHDATESGACWRCGAQLGALLAPGAVVVVQHRRYPRGEYGPRPIVRYAGRVLSVARDMRDSWCVRLQTRKGLTREWTCSVRPVSARKGS